ncbi:hypothetical protein IWW56_003914, partial [Coemansia sp. RSA 2131]
MSLSDSDSDDFFSDIRLFRQKLGLSRGSSHAQPSNTDTKSSKRAAPEGSAVRQRKQQCIDVEPDESGPRTSGTLGVVSAGEIAALISPHA